ncbi:RNA-directed DNA polymerase from mobile element jockey-like [Brachionus plicatilis]|uniref:RNA-directed DNA polymerase from mobile element jockey-like n=1 Tax=Brachionus plicatilis TaxID=10195 RepID=A0A3M7TC57_BRAPC|nr:RNA-directed DNA polymerase from mobile element jockey-like [Brachionus plicatilis]
MDKVHPQIWRSLRKYYLSMALLEKKDETSRLFRTTIDEKQGGPLSHKLFSIYTEDLGRELEKKNIGTKIHDIFLLTETLNELQQAINICEKYGMHQEIKFNPGKTQFIIFGKKPKVTDKNIKPKMYNHEIKCVNKI